MAPHRGIKAPLKIASWRGRRRQPSWVGRLRRQQPTPAPLRKGELFSFLGGAAAAGAISGSFENPPLRGQRRRCWGCPCSGQLDIPLARSPRALSPFKEGIFSCSRMRPPFFQVGTTGGSHRAIIPKPNSTAFTPLKSPLEKRGDDLRRTHLSSSKINEFRRIEQDMSKISPGFFFNHLCVARFGRIPILS